MTEPRRFTESEVREIFEQASSTHEGRALASSAGLTLGELQAIGLEVGLQPERIAAAATALDLRRGAHPVQTQLGMPITVGRTVPLPRAPNDEEWHELVAALRATFRATGKEWSSGGMRQWTNGNLHAFVEKAGDQVQLRLGTTKGDGQPITFVGIGGLVMSVILGGSMLLAGTVTPDLVGPLVLALGGGSILGINSVRLRSWAAEREAQMAAIAERAVSLLTPGDHEQLPGDHE